MTKAELNQILLEGITQSIQADKSLPENLADRYVDWVHGLIKQGQAKQMQKSALAQAVSQQTQGA